jgi:hypothetical protein
MRSKWYHFLIVGCGLALCALLLIHIYATALFLNTNPRAYRHVVQNLLLLDCTLLFAAIFCGGACAFHCILKCNFGGSVEPDWPQTNAHEYSLN